MAKLEQGILGPFRGTVGTVIGYRWRDRWCMRARPSHYNDRRSEAQLRQRGRFKAMIQFASPATPLLRIGLRAWAAGHGLTEGNAFLRLNHEAFGSGSVDYARLQFSRGHLPAVRLTAGAVGADGVATVEWSKEGGRNEDRVHLYVYCPAAGRGLVAATVERGRRRARFLLPQQMACAEVHLWAVAENAAGEVSATAYLPLGDADGRERPSADITAIALNTSECIDTSAEPAVHPSTDGRSLQSSPPPLPPGGAT